MSKRKRAPQVIVVGCGGTTFESIASIAIHTSITGADRLILLDHDNFEQGNTSRQLWGSPGEPKVSAAADVFNVLLPSILVEAIPARAQWYDGWRNLKSGDTIIALPDNLESQVFCYEQAVASKKRVIFACGGSDRTPASDTTATPHGGAIGILVNGDKASQDRLREYHPEMFSPPEQVVAAGTAVPRCTDIPEQTAADNLYTAVCLSQVLSTVREGGALYVEHAWASCPTGCHMPSFCCYLHILPSTL